MTFVTNWSDDRVAELTKLYEEGHSSSQIALMMGGATRNSVIGKVHRLKLPTPPNRKMPGIRAPREPKKKQEHQKVFRFIAANGNSNALRIHETIQTEPRNLRCVEVEPRNLSFLELETGDCRYPSGDNPREMTFCGRPIKPDSSYCFEHASLCYRAPEPPRPKAWRVAA